MKKSVISFVIVALMAATTLFGQEIVSGATTSVTAEPAVVENNNEAGAIQNNGSKFNLSVAPDHNYGNVTVGYRFGKEDSVPKQIVIGAEAKEMFRIGDSPILLGLSALGQARTNGSEFCVEYADLGLSAGFEVGNFYLGLTPKVNIKTPKGLKVQLDAEWYPTDGCVVYGYLLGLVNTSDDNKNYVVSGSKWAEGSDRYQEYAGGVGIWYQFSSGCFVSLDTGVFWTNNQFITKDGAKTSLSWKSTVKAGGQKLAGVFSYERGGELTSENKPVDRFMVGIQTSF